LKKALQNSDRHLEPRSFGTGLIQDLQILAIKRNGESESSLPALKLRETSSDLPITTVLQSLLVGGKRTDDQCSPEALIF
jgi:hypothetical protein